MTEIEQYVRDAARQRRINPDVAVKVANSEGGVTEYARRGTFPTGSSWWPFQLHYGGAGYEYLGTVAGMGNDFTRITGWQPGDPNAWRASVDFALDHASQYGWKAWYGAQAVNVGDWEGINWDGGDPPPPLTMAQLAAANPNIIEQRDTWQHLRRENRQDPRNWGDFRDHVNALGGPDPGGVQPVDFHGAARPTMAQLVFANRSILEQRDTWQRLSRENGGDPNNWTEFRQHLLRLYAPDPGLEEPEDFRTT